MFSLGNEFNTYTILARDAKTGMLGICITTYSIAVGGYCPKIDLTIGAVVSQAYTNPVLRNKGLELLKITLDPQNTLRELCKLDSFFEYRQIGIIDTKGKSAVHTGKLTTNWKGHIIQDNLIVMGNCLKGKTVLDAMLDGFFSSEKLNFAERLLSAIQAGQSAGGQSKPMYERSSALIVYKDRNYPMLDLRIDYSNDAVADLKQLYTLYKPYIPLYYDLRVTSPDQAPSQLKWESNLETK